MLPSESPGSPASVLITGGNGTENGVNRNTTVVDVASNSLTRRSDLQRSRWYGTSTTLVNGEVYIQGGINGTDRPEVRSLTGVTRLLGGADTSILDFYYPRNFVAPDGRVFGFDSNGRMYYVDTVGDGGDRKSVV